jgi:uncharacterized protein (TIGR02246 family)
MSSVRDVCGRNVQLYNAGDLEGLVNLYSEDGVLITPDGTFEGRAAILEAISRALAAFPERTLTIDVVVEQGDTIAVEWTHVGMNTGPMPLPDGTEVPPTGKQVEFKGMSLVRARDGKMAVHHMYYDNMALAGQLGLLPDGAST